MSANPAERNLKAKERIPNLIAAAVLGVSLYSTPDLQGSSTNIEQPPPPVPITNPSPSETSIPKNQIIENPSVNQALEAIQNYYSGLDTEKIFNNKESIKGPFVELRIPEINVEDGKSELFYPKEINSYGLIIDSDGKSNLILIPPSIQIGGQEFNAKLVNEPKSSTYKITYTNSSGVSVDLDLEKTVISGQPVIQSPKDTIIISTTGESNGWIAKLSTNIGGNNNETINASYFIDDNKINIIINGYQINLPLEELSKYINFEDESNGKLEVILDNQEPNIAVLYHNDKYFGEINLSDGSFIIELNQSYITSKNIMNIRKGPSTSESKIGQLTPDNFKQIKYLETVDDKGTKIDPNDPNNDNYWHKVDLGNGQIGYIAGKLNGQEYSILQQETQNLKINPDNNIILLPKPDFEKNEIKSSIGNFVNALNKAGIRITPEQVTQGLTYQTIEVPKKDPKTGEVIKDEAGNEVRETVVFGVYNLPPEVFPPEYQELAGEYPILMWQKEKGWNENYPKELSTIKNFPVGIMWGGFIIRDPNFFGKEIVKAPNYFSFIRETMLDLQTPIEEGRYDLRRGKDTFNFYIPDLTFNYAREKKIPIALGHVFGGNSEINIPDWVKSINNREEFINFMTEHLSTIVSRYKTDEIPVTIILVNEYFGNPFQNTPTFKFWKTKANSLGITDEELMSILFAKAKEIAPNTTFIFNEYGMEIPGSYNYSQNKDFEIFSLLQKCKERSIPIDGIGFQMHLYAKDFYGNRNFIRNLERFKQQIQRYKSLGIEVYITELDIRIDDMPNVPLEERLLLQAKIYQSIIRAARDAGVKSITIWGTADWESWLNNPELTGSDSEETRPLFLDKNNQRKISYYAILKGLFSP